ncbi:MAG: 1-acyl-sn-glycerol-3-phosphate acyltransferase [Bacteroidales bacterium]
MPDIPDKQDVPFIELEKIIYSKNPAIVKLIPGFILRYLKRVIHQDELNEAMERLKGYHGLEFIDLILNEFGAQIQVQGLEHIPAEGRFIIASNHPLGGLDGLALMKVTGQVRKDIVFPVNDLLMIIPNIRELFIPINKHGSNSSNLQIMDDTFASDKAMLYFPAGLCSRKTKGIIMDLEWKKTFISKAKKFQRDIIPTFVDGRNSQFFYNLANIRKKLGIKANLEMLYLVDEMFKQQDKIIRIHFGKPISYTVFTRDRNDRAWASLMKTHVYRLGQGKDNFGELIG